MLSTACKYTIALTVVLGLIVIGSHCFEESRCKTGITGSNCDQCARGYFGEAPNCEHCGECFDQWEERVQNLKNRTQALLDKVKRLLEVGTNGNFVKEFTDIEGKLDRIKYILDNKKLKEEYILDLERQIENATGLLNQLRETVDRYDAEARNTTDRTNEVLRALFDMDLQIANLTAMIDILDQTADDAQGQDVEGAYQIILTSQNRSREAEKSVQSLSNMISEEGKMRRDADSKFTSLQIKFNSTISQNEANLNDFANRILILENKVPGINKFVCASSSTVNNCDQLCGGALCKECGGISCFEGATTKAKYAQDTAIKIWILLNEKFNRAKSNLDGMSEAFNDSVKAYEAAKKVLEDCNFQKSKFNTIANEIDDVMDGIDKFSLVDGARPAEIRTLGNECTALSISLTPEQIRDLAFKINETISTLTDIQKILEETADKVAAANDLRKQADDAKQAAEQLLNDVQQILEILRQAAIEQARARAEIEVAEAEMAGVKADLTEINSDTESLNSTITWLEDDLKRLQDRLKKLDEKYAQNELYLGQANATAVEADKEATKAEQKTNELEAKVEEARDKLSQKALRNGELKDRAERLKNDVGNLALEVKLRMELLRELDDIFDGFVRQLKDYQGTVDELHKQMNEYIKDIDLRAQYYRECQT